MLVFYHAHMVFLRRSTGFTNYRKRTVASDTLLCECLAMNFQDEIFGLMCFHPASRSNYSFVIMISILMSKTSSSPSPTLLLRIFQIILDFLPSTSKKVGNWLRDADVSYRPQHMCTLMSRAAHRPQVDGCWLSLHPLINNSVFM